jgi:hypothetical protein
MELNTGWLADDMEMGMVMDPGNEWKGMQPAV